MLLRNLIFTILLFFISITSLAQPAEINQVLSLAKGKWSTPTSATYKGYRIYKPKYKLITLKGHESKARLPNNNNVFGEICGALEKKGWSQDVNVAADGPSGSTWGCKKDDLRLIVNEKSICQHIDGPAATPCTDTNSNFTLFLGK